MLHKKKIIGALGGNLIETIVGFLVIMFVTRNYTQAETGVYFIVIAIISILNNLKEGFLQNGFVKFLVENEFESRVLKTGFTISFIGEIVKILIFISISLFYQPIQTYIIFYSFYTLTYSLYRMMLFVHKSKLDMKEIVSGNLIILVATAVGVGVIYRLSLAAEWLFLVMGLTNLLALIFIPSNRKLLMANAFRGYDKVVFQKIFSFGKYGFLKEVSGSIAHQAAIFISAYLLTLEATSILGLATRYTILISIPGASLAGMLYPIILKHSGNRAALVEAARDGIGKMYALLIPIAIVIIIGSPFAIYLLHGAEYLTAAGVLVFKILASVFLIPLGSGFSSLMNTINKPREITRLMVISSISNITLSFILMSQFGLWGAAIAPLLTELIGGYIMKVKLKETLDFDVFGIMSSIRGYWVYWISKALSWKKLRYQS